MFKNTWPKNTRIYAATMLSYATMKVITIIIADGRSPPPQIIGSILLNLGRKIYDKPEPSDSPTTPAIDMIKPNVNATLKLDKKVFQ